MNQSLYLEYDNGSIGVIRNPYERLVALYRGSWKWTGFDNWIKESKLQSQVELYKDCDMIITLENWEQDLIALNIEQVTNSSILMEQTIAEDYRRWYTDKSLNMTAELVKPDLVTYGYSY
jgi:hypothetical protein